MLLDSNVLICACQPKHDALRRFIERQAPSVSIITKIETLGYHRLSEQEREVLDTSFRVALVR